MQRISQVLAWVGILVALIGVPYVLFTSLGTPQSWEQPIGGWGSVFTSPLGAGTMVTILAVVAWIAWLVFSLSLIVELINAIGGFNVTLPGFSAPQAVARRLVAAALLGAVIGAPASAHAATLDAQVTNNASMSYSATIAETETALVGPQAPGTLTASSSVSVDEHDAQRSGDAHDTADASTGTQADATYPRYTVQPPHGGDYDCLWDIAERHLGDPMRWKEIYTLNTGPGVTDPVHDPDLIYAGQVLTMPHDAVGLTSFTNDTPAPGGFDPSNAVGISDHALVSSTSDGEAQEPGATDAAPNLPSIPLGTVVTYSADHAESVGGAVPEADAPEEHDAQTLAEQGTSAQDAAHLPTFDPTHLAGVGYSGLDTSEAPTDESSAGDDAASDVHGPPAEDTKVDVPPPAQDQGGSSTVSDTVDPLHLVGMPQLEGTHTPQTTDTDAELTAFTSEPAAFSADSDASGTTDAAPGTASLSPELTPLHAVGLPPAAATAGQAAAYEAPTEGPVADPTAHHHEAGPTPSAAPEPGPSATAPVRETDAAESERVTPLQSGDMDESGVRVVTGNPATSSLVAACGLGGILAGGIVTSLRRRRSDQRRDRTPGSRIALPEGQAASVEQSLRTVAPVIGPATVDATLLNLAQSLREAGRPFPPLNGIHANNVEVSLFTGAVAEPVAPWATSPEQPLVWYRMLPRDGDLIAAREGVDRPYPALVTVGQDSEGGLVLIDVETVGALGFVGPTDVAQAAASATVLELLTGPWSSNAHVTTVGLPNLDLPYVCEDSRYRTANDLDAELARLRRHGTAVSEQLRAAEHGTIGEARAAGDVPEACDTEVLVVAGHVTDEQLSELQALARGDYGHAVCVITAGIDPVSAWVVTYEDSATLPTVGAQQVPQAATFHPAGTRVWPQLLAEDLLSDVREVLETTDAPAEPGPEWAIGIAEVPATATSPDALPTLQAPHLDTLSIVPDLRSGVTVKVLGEPVIDGAEGPLPRTAGHDHEAACTELLAVLALHRAPVAAATLCTVLRSSRGAWSDKTLRTRIAQARAWLGEHHGEQLVPLAAEGTYRVSHNVRTDWDDFLDALGGSLATASVPAMIAALRHVRGVPFSGLNSCTYQWAMPYFQEMLQGVVDVAHQCATRALAEADFASAREAVQTGLAVDRDSDILWVHALRIEAAASDWDAFEQVQASYDAHCESHDRERGEMVVTLLREVERSGARSTPILSDLTDLTSA